MKAIDRESIRRVLDSELTHIKTSSRQRQTLYENAKGGKKVKKKSIPVLVTAVVLMLAAGTALASTGALDALLALLRDSFSRMNTSAAVDVVDRPDVPRYLEQFEDAYGGRKEDLILSTVPGEDDLSLNDALRIARQAIMERFGTPEAELDAMGVYPAYYETPYTDELSQWRIYFSPRTNADLDEDHDCPAPGEYLADVDSPSGEVSGCFYYNDDFWPEYALRCWENGSREYVFSQACRPDFLKQSTEDQKHFISLFAEAGYDTAPLLGNQRPEARLRAMETELYFADPEEDLLDSSDSFVLTALAEMESRCGITREDLEKCHFIALRSPQASATGDICFSYNFKKAEAAEAGYCETMGMSYASNLGFYMVSMDRQTGEVTGFAHIPRNADDTPAGGEGLLARSVWTGADLPEYEALIDELRALDAGYVSGRDSLNALHNRADEVMLRHGGDPQLYTADRDENDGVYTLDRFLYEHQLTEDMIHAKGLSYLLENTSYTEEELKHASFITGTRYDDTDHPDQNRQYPTLLVLLEKEKGRGMVWFFHFDTELNITQFEETEEDLHG